MNLREYLIILILLFAIAIGAYGYLRQELTIAAEQAAQAVIDGTKY